MENLTFVGVLFWGMILCTFVIYVSFSDPLGLLLKTIPILNAPKDYEQYKKVREDARSKRHRKKWKRKYLVYSLMLYIVAYILVTMIMQSALVGFLMGLSISIGRMIVLSKKEAEERRVIEAEIMNEQKMKR